MNTVKEPDEKIRPALNAIVSFFPEYQDIMYKVFTTSQNMSNHINLIKKTIFDEILITYHEEALQYITYIIHQIQSRYTPKYYLAIADFIDLIYQNTFYDIFATKFQELEIASPESIKEAHLMIFNLIIYVEHIKYKFYEELEKNSVNNKAILNTLLKRKSNSLQRINVCINLLDSHPKISDEEFNYENVINKYNIFTRNDEFKDIYFKEIN